jgi:Tol biopolymer transport system component
MERQHQTRGESMRYVSLAVALALAQAAAAQRPYDLPIRRAPVRKIAEFPAGIGAVAPSGNPDRLYYSMEGKLYVFDVSSKKSAFVAEGDMGNLAVSPTNDRLAFVRDAEDGKTYHVWTMPLNPKTGLAAAPARRLSLTMGDQPRFSPDGKWVAFSAYDSNDASATQHLAVISADGGAERVVARSTGGIGLIQWTPDGHTIYLLANKGRNQPGWTWRALRVAAAGGPVDTVPLRFYGFNPGLSLDGSLVAYPEDGSVSNYVVADARGVPVSRFSVAAPGDVGWAFRPSWNGARSLVANGTYVKKAVRLADIDNGGSREIVPPEFQPEAPFWSPDGKSVATFATSQGKRVLLVVDAANGKRKEYTAGVVQACCVNDGSPGLRWSPDGKAIAFHGDYRGPLRVIELATGTVRDVGLRATLIGEYRWRSDSRALQYTATANARDAYRAIHETMLDGSDRVLLDKLPNAVGAAGMRSDTTAVFNSDSGVFLISTRTRRVTRLGPSFSQWVDSDRQGTTFVLAWFGSNGREVAIVGANGTASTLKLPLTPVMAPFNPAPVAFHPDGRIVFIGRGAGRELAVFAADPKGGEPRKLFDIPKEYDTGAHRIDLSPDGKFLAYTVGPRVGAIAQIDLTSFVPVTQTSKP